MPDAGFRHEAFLYEKDIELVDAAAEFVSAGVAEGAATLVVIDADKIARLRGVLGDVGEADGVRFEDMATVGANPARIIPAWRSFVDSHAGTDRPLRGIGEPVWPGRSADELVECRLHESLLNVAFADDPPFWLLCPYDASALDAAVLDGARCTHPHAGRSVPGPESDLWGTRPPDDVFGEPLAPPPPTADVMEFLSLGAVRRFVRDRLTAHRRTATLPGATLAVNEVAANSLRHGGGRGTLTMWRDGDSIVCQVDDDGVVSDPLAGRRKPVQDQLNGRGLWLANQLCRLVQIRHSARGTSVRLHLLTVPDDG
jgi:anti-sigma regulatory factor (Ser/Thr protein kinase)